jgi:hypothetical protein
MLLSINKYEGETIMKTWKVVENYENYEVSTDGEIKSVRSGRILNGGINGSGYQYLKLTNRKISKSVSAHKIVMEHFGSPKPDGDHIIDHIDGNKTNNKIDNLQWISISENTEKYYNNYEKKKKVLELHAAGYKVKQIKDVVGLADCTIRQIIHKANSAA